MSKNRLSFCLTKLNLFSRKESQYNRRGFIPVTNLSVRREDVGVWQKNLNRMPGYVTRYVMTVENSRGIDNRELGLDLEAHKLKCNRCGSIPVTNLSVRREDVGVLQENLLQKNRKMPGNVSRYVMTVEN